MQMVFGRRRDEWDRMAALMCLVADRTNFSTNPKPSDPADFIPAYLIEKQSIAAQQEPKLEPISVHDLIAMAGVR